MSLIKCPECGREISTSTEICVHCGCKVTVCPDCKKVFIGSKEICDNCGCKLKPHTEVNANKTVENENIFLSSVEQGQKLKKTISTIGWALSALCVVFIAIIISKAISWKNSELFDKLANANSTYNSINKLITIYCVLGVFCVISRIPNELTYYITARRLLSANVNTDEYYRSYVNNNQKIVSEIQKKDFDEEDDRKESEEKAKEKFSFSLYAVWLIQNKNGMAWLFFKIGVNVLLSVISAICIGVLIDNAFKNYFVLSVIEGDDPITIKSGSSFDWMAIIPVAVIIAVECVVNFLFNLYKNKSVAKWQQATNERLEIIN